MNQFFAKSKFFNKAFAVVRGGRKKKVEVQAPALRPFEADLWLTKYHTTKSKEEGSKVLYELSRASISVEQVLYLRAIFNDVDPDVMSILDHKYPADGTVSGTDQEHYWANEKVWRLVTYWRGIFQKKRGRV